MVNYESLLYGKRHLSAVCPIFIVMIYDYDTLPDLGFVGFGAVVGSVVRVVGVDVEIVVFAAGVVAVAAVPMIVATFGNTLTESLWPCVVLPYGAEELLQVLVVGLEYAVPLVDRIAVQVERSPVMMLLFLGKCSSGMFSMVLVWL